MAHPLALLVEDTPEYLLVGRRLLEQAGFVVLSAGDGEEAVRLAQRRQPELILLDVVLPGLDGFEVCRLIRQFSDAYVVMVSAKSDEIDRITGLRVGADDYVVKPFSRQELAARIAAMRRRPRVTQEAHLLDFGELVVDTAAREATIGQQVLELTRVEFDVLVALAGAPRMALTRRQLIEAVWGPRQEGSDHTIDVHVANLRAKLGESGSEQRHIRTVRGVGFRFEP